MRSDLKPNSKQRHDVRTNKYKGDERKEWHEVTEKDTELGHKDDVRMHHAQRSEGCSG
jgi:hypothetical protein